MRAAHILYVLFDGDWPLFSIMMIWVLALVVLASVAALGYRQGAVRVAFSFVGILFGALLAVPLGRILGRLLGLVGVKDQLTAWVIGPVLVFVGISIVFKVAAFYVHQKVDVFYKYHAGDLRLALWERLNHRLGLCLGLVNGAAYFILISFLIYVPSYATVQVTTSEQDPRWMRWLTSLGHGLHDTGFDRVTESINSIDRLKFAMVDFGALVYYNPLAQARLGRYPGLLSLSERPEFQELGNDNEFRKQWAQGEPVMNLLDYPRIAGIRSNPDTLQTLWNTIAAELPDLNAYLVSGHSAKYDSEKGLGRWDLEVRESINLYRRSKATISSTEMLRIRQAIASAAKTSFVLMPGNTALLKSPSALLRSSFISGSQPLQAQWKTQDGKTYQFSMPGAELNATIEGDRMTVRGETLDLVFYRED